MFKLVIEDDEGNKTVVPVIRDEITIGRQEGNTIRLTERNVSREHARLVREDDGVLLEEISARYGTKKNGEKISGNSPFGIGDVVLIGDYRLTLEGETAPEPEAKAKPNGKAKADSASGFASAATQITHIDDIERRGQGTEILPAMPAKLVVVSSNFAGQEFPLNNPEVVIGRADECDIIIDHRSVSQTHAKVVREKAGTYKIVDLNSKNGVKVSGEEYRAVHLKRGDVVELGHVKFRFVEPGENYVFTPQSIIEDDFDEPVPGKNNNIALIVGAVVGVVVLVALAFAVLGGGEADDPTPKPDPVAQNNSKTPDPVADPVEAPADDKVQKQLAKAEQQLSDGKPERAIADLTTARDILTPTKSEREKIDTLLSKARRERPLEEALDDGRDHFKEDRYVEALRKFKEIPPDPPSEIYRIMMAEDLPKKTIGRVLKQASAAKEEGETEEAQNLVEEVLLFDPDNATAATLKTELSAMAAKPAPTKRPPTKRPPKRPAKKKLTAEEREQRLADARAALMSGNQKKAISLCKPVKSGGCYRIMGVAYKKLGDHDKFCKFMKRGGSTPGDCD